MPLMMKEEADPFYSMYNQTFYISNESKETGINMSNLHYRTMKSVKINKYLHEVKDVKSEIVNTHPPTHTAFVIGLDTIYRHHRSNQESLALKHVIGLKSVADTIRSTTQKAM